LGGGQSHGSNVNMTHMVILTLMKLSVLCTGRWHTGERRYNSTRASRGFLPKHEPRAPTANEVGWAPDVLETRSLALTGIEPRYVTRQSPYPRHQTTPSWLDTVQAKRVLLQMKSQPVTVLSELSTQYKWVHTEGQSSVMSEGTH